EDAAVVRPEGEQEGGAGGDALGARGSRQRRLAGVRRCRVVRRAVDEGGRSDGRGSGPPDRDRLQRRRGRTRSLVPQPRSRRGGAAFRARGRRSRLGSLARRLRGGASRPRREGTVVEPSQIVLAPIVSEKSYAGTTSGLYTFRVHDDAHRTQVRQAV